MQYSPRFSFLLGLIEYDLFAFMTERLFENLTDQLTSVCRLCNFRVSMPTNITVQ